MSKIENGGLDQYGAEPFEQHKFGTSGVEGVKPDKTAANTQHKNLNNNYRKLYVHRQNLNVIKP